MTSLFGSSNSGGSGGSGSLPSLVGQGVLGLVGQKQAKPAADSTAAILTTAPTPKASVPVPDVTPAAPIPNLNGAAVLAAGNAAANTIAQRAGRASTILTRRQPRAAPQTIAGVAPAGGSDYAAKTLG